MMTGLNDLLLFFLLVIWIPLVFVVLLLILYIVFRYLIKLAAILEQKRRTCQYKEVTVEAGNMGEREGSFLQDIHEVSDSERLHLISNEGECQQDEADIDGDPIGQSLELHKSKKDTHASVVQQDKSFGNAEEESSFVVEIFHEGKSGLTKDGDDVSNLEENAVDYGKAEEGSKKEKIFPEIVNGGTNETQNSKNTAIAVSEKYKSSKNGDSKDEAGEPSSPGIPMNRRGIEETDKKIVKEEEEEEEDTNHICKHEKITEMSVSEMLGCSTNDPLLPVSSKDLAHSENSAQNEFEERDSPGGSGTHLNRLSPVSKEKERNDQCNDEKDRCIEDFMSQNISTGSVASINFGSTAKIQTKVVNILPKLPDTPPKRPQKLSILPETPRKPPRRSPRSPIGIKPFSQSVDFNLGYPSKPSPLLFRKQNMQGYSSESKPPPLPSSLPRNTRYKKSSPHEHNLKTGIEPSKPTTGRFTDTSFTNMMTRVQEENPEETGDRQGRPHESSLTQTHPRKPKRKPAVQLRPSPPHAPPPPPPNLKSPSSPIAGSSQPCSPRSPPPLPPTTKPLSGERHLTSDEYENAACAPPSSSRTLPRKGSTRVVKPTLPPPRPPVQSNRPLFYATSDVAQCVPTTISKGRPSDKTIMDEQSSSEKFNHRKLVRQEAVVINKDTLLSSRSYLKKLDFGPVEEEFINPIYDSSDQLASPSMNRSTTNRQYDQQVASNQQSSGYNEQYITAVATADEKHF